MATVDVRDASGGVVGSRELPAELFERPVNVPLMHQVVVAGAAAARAGTHATKTRGRVRGGGVKPWRQKGTGRARQGSIRAPQWTGGGVAHGPQPTDHSVRVNKKMKRAALRSSLSDALASGKLAVVDAVSFDEPKTKSAVALLHALELTGRVLVVLEGRADAVELSFRNLPFVKVVYPGNLSTFDLLAADRILFTAGALDALAGTKAEVEEPSQDTPVTPDAEPDAGEPEEERGPAETFEEPGPGQGAPDEGDEVRP
ncbi:MAG: 50S ribosomal protein L4 [Actinomycetota bacterium]